MTPEKKKQTKLNQNEISKKIANRYKTAMPSEPTLYITSKSNLHYTRGITPMRVTSGGAHLCGLAAGLHSSERTSQRWLAVGDTAPIWPTRDLNPRPSAPIACAQATNGRFVHNIKIEISIYLLCLAFYDGPSSRIWRWTLGSAETAEQMRREIAMELKR